MAIGTPAAGGAGNKADHSSLYFAIRYRRSPASVRSEVMLRPSFFLSVPDRAPRTEWACQPVAFCISDRLAPCGRRSSSMTLACLLPPRVSREERVLGWVASELPRTSPLRGGRAGWEGGFRPCGFPAGRAEGFFAFPSLGS